LVGVKITVAEQLLADPRALHEEADVETGRSCHAAMHLHAFLHGERPVVPRGPLPPIPRAASQIGIERLQRLNTGRG